MTAKTARVDLAEEEADFLAEVDYSEAPEVAYSAVGGPVVAPEADCLEADLEVVDLEENTTVKAARADLAEDEEEDFLAVVDYSEAPEVACLAVGDLALAQVVDCSEADLEAVDSEETTAVVLAGGGLGGGQGSGLFGGSGGLWRWPVWKWTIWRRFR
ncbi:hypothetical protein MTO96_040055 [Rhipicephalus appendiculatus]